MKKSSLISVIILIGILLIGAYFVFNTMTGNFLLDMNYEDSGYAVPYDIFNNNASIFDVSPEYISGEDSVDFFINVSHPNGVIYSKGYIYDFGRSQWEVFYLNGTFIGISPWISESASTSFDLDSSNFLRDGLNYVVAYSCKKHDGTWKCGCNSEDDCGHWMLQVINVSGISNPAIPSCVNDSDCGPGGECYKGVCRKIPEPPEAVPIYNCQDLQNMKNNLSGNYYLANNIDCSDTQNWNDGAGFEPIGSPGINAECYDNYPKEDKSFNEVICSSLDDPLDDLLCESNCVTWGEDESFCNFDWTSCNYAYSEGVCSVSYSYLVTPEKANIYCSNSFSGSFDGAGHIISNLSINRPDKANIGLFGASIGSLLHVHLKNVNVTGFYSVGALAGSSEGTIDLCAITDGTVTGSANGAPIGGMVGYNKGTIQNSYVILNYVKNKWSGVGALAGFNSGMINNSYAVFNNLEGTTKFAGLVGVVVSSNGVIENSFVVGGDIKKKSAGNSAIFGALVTGSFNLPPSILNSYWQVTGSGPTNCYEYLTTGNVITSGDSGCTRITDSNYFKNRDNAPMNSWDFTNTWAMDSNKNEGYPYLKVFDSDDN